MMTRTRRWSTDFERECEVIYQRSCHTANPCDDAYIGILDLQRNEIIPAQINSNYLQNLPLFIIILESPHIDEFNTNGIAIGPAQGSTGNNIRSLLIQLLQPQTVYLQRKYRLMLVEAIPYQCSNNTSPIDRTNTNRLFKKMWRNYGGKIDFENRINQYRPDVILNACTGGIHSINKGSSLKGLVQKVLRTYKRCNPSVRLLYSNHPAMEYQFRKGIFKII